MRLRATVLWFTALAAICSACRQDSSGNATASSVASATSSSAPPVASSASGPSYQEMFIADIGRDFAKEHSCPENRVTVTPRPEIDAMQFHPRKANPPSAEVKADPERYAKWKADDESHEKAHREYYWSHHVYEVSGCNITELQDCGWYRGDRGGAVPWAAKCQVVTIPKKK